MLYLVENAIGNTEFHDASLTFFVLEMGLVDIGLSTRHENANSSPDVLMKKGTVTPISLTV